jgi:hypothetical protein
MAATPEYDAFEAQAREQITQQMAEVRAYQAQAAQLLANSGNDGVRVDAREPE